MSLPEPVDKARCATWRSELERLGEPFQAVVEELARERPCDTERVREPEEGPGRDQDLALQCGLLDGGGQVSAAGDAHEAEDALFGALHVSPWEATQAATRSRLPERSPRDRAASSGNREKAATPTLACDLGSMPALAIIAVVVEDYLAADLHEWYGRYLYFAPDEVEPLAERNSKWT